MDAVRDFVDMFGLQPETFNILIILCILVGGAWAVKRLYTDLTTPLPEEPNNEDMPE
jgi:hypothetical protein